MIPRPSATSLSVIDSGGVNFSLTVPGGFSPVQG
jgi:hypothetical protein